ncbi:MAG: peptide ABC transporter substrate-binding protein [Alphaproteobacteria bacterium]
MTRFLACLGAVLVCAGVAFPAHAQKDTLTIGLTQFPSTFNPHIDSMLAKSYILAMTRRSITTYDPSWTLVCQLCVALPTLENGKAKIVDLPNGKKGMQLTVQLRKDAKWGDGTPVTVKDVVFTWEVGRHEKTGVSDIEGFRRILKIEPIDDHNFTMTIDRVTFKYNDMTGMDLLPAHLEAKAFADPATYKTKTAFDTDTANPGLYFGPYRITQVSIGSHVVLEPNPTWYGQKPYFKRIVVKVIGNTAALEANLLSGGVDYVAGELGLSLDQALAFETRHKGKYNIVYKAGLIYEHIDVNLDNPLLKDRRVRQALMFALDRADLVKQLFAGRQPVADGQVSPLDWMISADVPKYGFDPKRAAELLDQAGWKPGAGGVRVNAKGERLVLELMTTAGNRSRELVQQVLQNQWRKVGIDVRLKNEPARVFFGETVTRRKFPALAMFAWLSAPESVPRSTLHSEHIPSAKNNFAGQNYPGFANPEMDKLLDAIEIELDKEKRRALWQRLQTLYATELPALPLFFRADPFIMPLWLKGVEPTGHQYTSTQRVEFWRAE